MEYHRYININTLMSFLSEYLLLIYIFFIINYIFLKRRRYKIDTADRQQTVVRRKILYWGLFFIASDITIRPTNEKSLHYSIFNTFRSCLSEIEHEGSFMI